MKSSMKTLFVVAAILCGLTAAPAHAQFLYAGDSGNTNLRTIDPATGATLTSVPVTIGGEPAGTIKGLAAQPSTGFLFAVINTNQIPGDGGGSGFVLATIQPDTGAATVIGPLADRYAGLAFDGGGTLYGVTGDGGFTPETLYTIDPTTAQSTFFMSLGNGTDGEAIAYNTADGLMYHMSGWDNVPVEGGGGNIVFESIDLGTMAITDIPLTGSVFVNGNGLAYDAAAGDFVFSVLIEGPTDGLLESGFARVTTGGVVEGVGIMDEYAGGMAFSNYVPVELMSFSVE